MTKSQAVEAIMQFGHYSDFHFQNSVHTDLKGFLEVVKHFKNPNPAFKYGVHGDLYVSIRIGDMTAFGNTGITKEVFQEKHLESDHEVEEFDVDFSTGTVYYTVGDVLEDGTETRIEGNADFWEVVEKCQN